MAKKKISKRAKELAKMKPGQLYEELDAGNVSNEEMSEIVAYQQIEENSLKSRVRAFWRGAGGARVKRTLKIISQIILWLCAVIGAIGSIYQIFGG